jgi:hypothetical protein
VPQPTAQQAPVRQGYGQPAYAAQTQQYAPQPAHVAPTQHQPAAYAAGAGAAGGDWWTDRWSGGAPQPQPQAQPQQEPHAAAGGYGGQQAYAAAPAQEPPGPGGRQRRRGLSPGWIAFIAVDALLIIVAIVFAVQIFGGEPLRSNEAGAGASESAAAPQGDASPAPSDAASPAPAEVLAEFASPSRNITCQITSAGASCGIAELDQQPAPVEGCDGTTGYVVSIDGQGQVALPCVPSSDQPKKAGGNMDVLEYGETLTEGDFTCSSSENGMQCQYDPNGRGFSLARAGIGTF